MAVSLTDNDLLPEAVPGIDAVDVAAASPTAASRSIAAPSETDSLPEAIAGIDAPATAPDPVASSVDAVSPEPARADATVLAASDGDTPSAATETTTATEASTEVASEIATAPAIDAEAATVEAPPSRMDDARSVKKPGVQHVARRIATTPFAADVLTPWWTPADATRFGIQYIGQAPAEPTLVFRFSREVAARSAARNIHLLRRDGERVDVSFESGQNRHVLLVRNLHPGRYTVEVTPDLVSAANEPLGVAMFGPVYIE